MLNTQNLSWLTLRLCLGLPEQLHLKKRRSKKYKIEDVILLCNFTGQHDESSVYLNFCVFNMTKSKIKVIPQFLKWCLSSRFLVYSTFSSEDVKKYLQIIWNKYLFRYLIWVCLLSKVIDIIWELCLIIKTSNNIMKYPGVRDAESNQTK